MRDPSPWKGYPDFQVSELSKSTNLLGLHWSVTLLFMILCLEDIRGRP